MSALQSLSRDHHRALLVAQKLRRADHKTAYEARSAFLTFWRDEGQHHFRCEETILLPAYAHRGDPSHPLVLRVLAEHLEIGERAAVLSEVSEGSVDVLHGLGELLAAHVRIEERELFPLIETALSGAELDLLASQLAAAEVGCRR